MNKPRVAGALHIVATPIGHLDDFSSRAVDTLSAVACVAAEDTRRSSVLFQRYGIATPLLALHEHNEEQVAPRLLRRLQDGEDLALISDAGTPLISDPGYRLVQMSIAAGIRVTTVPGACALIAALSVAGLPTDQFCFRGFLPAKARARQERLQDYRSSPLTQVFYESSHRIVASIEAMADLLGHKRQAAVCRELTKRFETVLRGSLEELHGLIAVDANQQKGEFVIVVAGADSDPDQVLQTGLELALALQDHLNPAQAAKVAAKVSGAKRRDIYSRLNQINENA